MTDPAGAHNYTYDAINRLITATHPLPVIPTESFEYDGVGNRVTAGSYVYDSCNRLLEDNEYTYTYDNNGNMITKTKKSNNQTTTYTYNAENQLLRVDFPDNSFTTYRYDGLGRRIEKNVNGTITQYIYDNEDIILEVDGDSNILARDTHGPGIDEPLIMDKDGESYYYLVDGLGSITTITDSSQNIINSYTYDSFGSIIEQTGSLKKPFTYTGREYNPETQLYYYRTRYYDPRTGRFLQEDPIGFAGGVNFYTYCFNNPVNFADPTGLCPKKLLCYAIWMPLILLWLKLSPVPPGSPDPVLLYLQNRLAECLIRADWNRKPDQVKKDIPKIPITDPRRLLPGPKPPIEIPYPLPHPMILDVISKWNGIFLKGDRYGKISF